MAIDKRLDNGTLDAYLQLSLDKLDEERIKKICLLKTAGNLSQLDDFLKDIQTNDPLFNAAEIFTIPLMPYSGHYAAVVIYKRNNQWHMLHSDPLGSAMKKELVSILEKYFPLNRENINDLQIKQQKNNIDCGFAVAEFCEAVMADGPGAAVESLRGSEPKEYSTLRGKILGTVHANVDDTSLKAGDALREAFSQADELLNSATVDAVTPSDGQLQQVKVQLECKATNEIHKLLDEGASEAQVDRAIRATISRFDSLNSIFSGKHKKVSSGDENVIDSTVLLNS